MSRYRFLSSVRGFRAFAAVALALSAAPAANASLTWTKGSYTVASWQAAENNVLNKATCGTSALARLSDGKCEKFSTSGSDGNISNNQVVEWTLASPVYVNGLNVYSWWNDSGRDGINIQKVEVKTQGSDTWVNTGASAVSQDANTSANYVKLSDSTGGLLSDSAVSALRITFGNQDNSKTCYTEVELISVTPSPIPDDPPADETDYVVVTNGATMNVMQDWTSGTNLVWDFGSGAVPTVFVAEGMTVTIRGDVLGSVGFNKTGSGTLILAHARAQHRVLAGSATFTAEDLATYQAECRSGVNIQPIPLQTITFGGSAATPEIVITNITTGTALVRGTDFTVAYADNAFTGEATATITGINDYEGIIDRTVSFRVFTSFDDGAPVLPAGYTAVDCFYVNNSSLTTTGSGAYSWIDTGVFPKGDWTISIDFASGSYGKGDTQSLLCARNGTGTDSARICFWAVVSGVENSEMAGHPRIDLGGVITNAVGINSYSWAGRHSFQYHRGTAYLDVDAVATADTTNFTTSGRATLFASYYGNATDAPNGNAFSGAFYGAKFYDGAGALQMHLVPCVRDSDGAVGVYNLGAAKPGFMANGGTVPFSIDAPGRELLVNGGFETRTSIDGTLNNGNYGYLNRAYNNGQARTSAWFGGVALSKANGDYNVPSSFPTGTYCAPIGGNNLSQTFLCDRPVKARLTFKYMHRQTWNPGVAVDLIVSLDGVQLDRFAVPVNSSTIYNYAKADIFLPYSPEGHTLTISRSGTGDFYLDNISLKVTDVYQSNEFVCQLPGESFPATRLAPAEPAVIVSNVVDGVQLVAGTDYEVAYSNDYTHGRGCATVTGKGDYAGLKDTLAYKIVYRFDSDDFETNLSIRPADGMVTTTLANFPVLVRLSATRQPGFDPADCGEGGANLRFMLSDGTMLAHEIDWWDSEGESTVWVNVPSLTEDTTIYALWGPKGGYNPPAFDPSETWPDYVGVWHMNLDGNKVYDSSGNGYSATNAAATAASSPKIGQAASSSTRFLSSVTDLFASSASKKPTSRSVLTFSAWGSMDSSTGDKNNTFALAQKYIGWNDGTGGFICDYMPYYSPVYFRMFHNSGTGSTASQNSLTVVPKYVNGWKYFTCTVNGATASQYIDGAIVGTINGAHGILGPDVTGILQFGPGPNGVSGRTDEIRIRNGVASAAWVLADYRNQATDGFLVYGTIGKKTFSVPDIAGVTVPGVGATAVPVVAPVDDITGDALTLDTDYTLVYEDNTFGNLTGKAIVTGIGGYAGCITNTFEILGIVSTDLAADADWTVYSTPRIASSATVDLKGHALRVSALYAGGTVTDSVGGGQLIFDVPAGRTVTLNTALTGALKLVKTGAGVLVASKAGQTYTGGTDVLGGVLRCGGNGNINDTAWFGPNTSTVRCYIYVGPNGVLDPAGSSGWGYHAVALDGGMVSNTVARTGTSTICFNPLLSTTGDVALVTTGEYSWTSAGGDLGGATMTIENYNSVTIYPFYWNWSNGTIDFKRGGWLNTSRGAIDIRTCDLRQTGGALNVANALSVHDYYCSYSGDYASGSAALNVYGTFTPASTYFYGPTMQNGSAIDLSAKSGVWSTTSPNNGHHNGNKTVKFAANATVAIGLGERALAAGDKVVAWTSEPTTVVFTNANWYLKRRADGIYVNGTQAPGAAILPMSVPVQYIRSGAPAEPDLHLVNAATGAELVKETDYTVVYSDNAAPGTATVEVTGQGDYAGLVFTDEFTIGESFAASAAVPPAAYMDGTFDWSGVAVTDAVTGAALVEGTNYSYTYTLSGSTATITITGLGYYAGTMVEQTFEIAPVAYFTDFRSKIEITPAEGMVTTELTNFPALVRLSAEAIDGFNPADCGEGGSELAFLMEDGSEMLPMEVDHWNPEGESTVWVKVPTLAADTKIYAVYGRKDGRTAIASSPKKVWGDYVGVWHFSEASGVVHDSSVNGWNSTDNGGGTVSNLSAKVGLARNTAGTQFTIGVMNLAASGNAKPLTAVSKFTISGWMLSTATIGASQYPQFMRNKNNWNDGNGWFAGFEASPTYFNAVGSGGTRTFVTVPSTVYNNWIYLTVVYNGGTVSIYENGSHVQNCGINSVVASTSQNLTFARNFTGRIDEYRIRDGVEAAVYIAADYKTMTETNFFEYGAVEPTGLPVYFAPIPAQRIRGAAVEPLVALTNTDTKAELVLGTDYTVAYENNASNGIGRAVVTGAGNFAAYTDARTFEILPAFEVAIPLQTVGPDGKILWQSGWVTDAETGAELSDGVDYSHTYEFVQSGDAYVARAVVTGLGGYAGATVTNEFAVKTVILVGGYTVAEEGTGLTWDSPVSLGKAISMFTAAPESYSEIWMKEGVYALTATLAWTFNTSGVAIRGGFAGTENSPAERDSAARTEFFGGGVRGTTSGTAPRGCLSLSNTKPVVIDCVNFSLGSYGLAKGGAGSITLLNCGFLDNYCESEVNGVGLRINASGADVVISNCTVCGNYEHASYTGAGIGMYVGAAKSLIVEDTLFASNSIPWQVGIGGSYNKNEVSRIGHGGAVSVNNVAGIFRRCRFLCNRSSYNSLMNVNPYCACNIYVGGSAGGTKFDHCVIAGNEMTNQDRDGRGAKISGGNMTINLSSKDATVEFSNCTIVYNYTPATATPVAINVHFGTAVIRNSIVANNYRSSVADSIGADIALTSPNSFAEVSYSMFSSNSTASVSASNSDNLVLGAGVIYGDPLLALDYPTVKSWVSGGKFATSSLGAFISGNLHPLSKAGYIGDDGEWTVSEEFHSPAIDTGDPIAALDKEPEPNGGIVNIGAFGGTAEASKSSSFTLGIDGEVSVDFPGEWAQPSVNFKVGGTGSYIASADVFISDDGNNFVYVGTISGLSPGMDVSYLLRGKYFASGSLWARIRLYSAKNELTAESEDTPVTKPLPPWYAKKGPANVIHVRRNADGAGDGTSWTDAFTSLRAAFEAVSAEKNEIWIATNTISLVVSEMDVAAGVVNALTVRGGFKGWEETADERPEGTITTIDGCNQSICLNLNNSAAVTVERMSFYRGLAHGFQKGGVGDLSLICCSFANTSLSGNSNGRGLYASGTAGTTVISAIGCEFIDNVVSIRYQAGSYGNGCGAYIANLGRAIFDDCLFAGNGCVGAVGGYMYGSCAGSALYASTVPVTMRGCRVVANTGNTMTNDGGGGHQMYNFGVVRLEGNCSDSAFTNCVFAANSCITASADGKNDTQNSGTIVVNMGAADRTLDIVNCTVAYNIGVGLHSPGGVNILSGSVTAKNSILFGNWHWNGTQNSTSRRAADVDVKEGASFAASWSLFTADSTNSLDGASEASITLGDGVVYGDPLFVTLLSDVSPKQYVTTAEGQSGRAFYANSATMAFRKAINTHLRGARGYFDEKTGELVTDYKTRETVSPAQDAGDPMSDYRGEPDTNDGWHGKRVNMGAWGNTPWATRTKFIHGALYIR